MATKLCSTEEAAEFELSKIGEEINILENEVSNDDQKIGFCHNDLQYGNIMMDEETKALTIIVSTFPALINLLHLQSTHLSFSCL